MDSFTGHKTREVLDTLKRYNWDVCMIPGGCTKYLQPLDVSVNRSLKCRLKDEYCKSIQSYGSKERHVSMAKEKMDMIIKNVNKAAYDIERKVILNGWKGCKR